MTVLSFCNDSHYFIRFQRIHSHTERKLPPGVQAQAAAFRPEASRSQVQSQMAC
jgi:hypothetical protein